MSKALVAYFSASGITKKVAVRLAAGIWADVFEIKPDNGYKIKSVIYNGENVTSKVYGGKFVVKSVELDGSLKVTFESITSPRTGDSSNLALWSAMLFLSGAGVCLLRKKVGM